MHLILLLALSFHHVHAATKAIEEARSSIRSLISPMLPGPKKAVSNLLKDFRVDKCQTEKIDWMDILMMRKPVTLVYKFKEGCDVEGSVVPMVFRPFPSDFRLRNLKFYDRVKTQNTIQATFESKPIMTIEMREGILYGKPGKVRFEADYKVQINPLNKDRPIEKNLGGEIRIKEISGQKVSIKEKIFIQ